MAVGYGWRAIAGAVAVTLMGVVAIRDGGTGGGAGAGAPPPPARAGAGLPPPPPTRTGPDAPNAGPTPGLPRSTVDRPDDIGGHQIHVMYVLPSDGVDRGLDTSGHLAGSVKAFNGWLRTKTPGRELRIDTYQGAVDTSFFRLNRTDAQVRSGAEFPGPAYVREIIEKDMKAAGFNKANTFYAVYYDGHSDYSCGGGAWPPELVGTVGAMYLLGLPDAPVTCASTPLPGANPDSPWYFDFGMLHELVHTMGFNPTCAPHQGTRAHTPDPTDLMYGGSAPWDLDNLTLDPGRDDWYQHGNSGCIDFDDSPWLRRTIPANADFDGNGTTDVALYRPSTGVWHRNGAATTPFGLAGDIPVPCDYDGNGATDIAVFRPSTGGWYVKDRAPVFFGLAGDVPVPGDYDGDRRCDVAVFRPTVGGWYVFGRAPVFFGLDGDIPVPADYEGDGSVDVAVFRPAVGGWYRNGSSTTFFGLSGDVPVPGDYDGDGRTDVAVFRPPVGGWFVHGQAPRYLGLAGDIPVPGDYDGNRTTDPAVFRPTAGAWFVQGANRLFFGSNGDLPAPLPAAIRMAAFP
jgi:hypothetical protein